MNKNELQQYLYEHIPLSKAMKVEVMRIETESVILSAPLAPNINHRETVFGGSASAVAILSAWSLIHSRLKSEGINSRIVIQRNTMNYELPISGTFTARSYLESPDDWQKFIHIFTRKGRARIQVSSVLEYDGKPVGHFQGEFVALGIKNT